MWEKDNFSICNGLCSHALGNTPDIMLINVIMTLFFTFGSAGFFASVFKVASSILFSPRFRKYCCSESVLFCFLLSSISVLKYSPHYASWELWFNCPIHLLYSPGCALHLATISKHRLQAALIVRKKGTQVYRINRIFCD